MTDTVQSEWNKLVRESRADPGGPPLPPSAPVVVPPKRRWAWTVPLLFVLSLVALGLYLQGTLNPWPAKPSQEEIDAGYTASMRIALQAIHDYAAFHGRYPQRIEEVLPLAIDIHYERTDSGFRLRMPGPGGEEIVVDGK